MLDYDEARKADALRCFSLGDGREIWRTARSDVPTWSTPAVYDDGSDGQMIVNGYRWVMSAIYSPEMFSPRILAFLREYQPKAKTFREGNDILTFFLSLWYLGLADQKCGRDCYLRLLKEALARYRNSLTDVVTMSIYGYHFRKLFWSPHIPLQWGEWWAGQFRPYEG